MRGRSCGDSGNDEGMVGEVSCVCDSDRVVVSAPHSVL